MIKNTTLFSRRSLTKGLAVLGLSLLFASCIEKDLLDTSDPMSVDESRAWTTEALTKQGMNGVYAGLRLGLGDTNRDYYQFDIWTTGMARNGSTYCNILWGSATSSDKLYLEFWKEMYEAIFRCNDAITNIPPKSACADPLKEQYVAEARFLRAYFYTKLNMLYRGVPLYEDVMVPDETDKPRSTEQEVWEFVLNDLQYCLEANRLPAKYAAGSSDYGRVTQGAAYALRGKVYMWLKEYEKAIADFNATEQCGYALFRGDYKQLFKEANEQCDEMIFSVQNIDREEYGSSTQWYCGARSTKGGTGWNTYMVQPNTVDLFETKEGEKFDWEEVIPGYNAMEPAQREVFFLRNSEGIEDVLRQNGFTGDIAAEAATVKEAIAKRLDDLAPETRQKYLPAGNEQRIRQAYENRDPRLGATVITPYSEFLGYFTGTGENVVTSRWPYRSESPDGLRDLKTDTPGEMYYLHRKWVYEGEGEITDRKYGPTDFPILRLADVVLLKAEALAELGRLQEARVETNRIRNRAGMPSLTADNTPTQAGLIDRIRNERRVELINEGHNFFDELRWGTWKEAKFDIPDAGISQVWGGLIRAYALPDNPAKLSCWPIPASEIEKNQALTQNAGW